MRVDNTHLTSKHSCHNDQNADAYGEYVTSELYMHPLVTKYNKLTQ